MTAETVQRLRILGRQLTENLMSAVLCAKEIGELAQAQANDPHDGTAVSNGRHGTANTTLAYRPVLDEATLSVTWRGRTVHLGHTQGFWLLTRLARRTNQYVTHLDLLREIWDDEFADTAVLRAGIRRLRVKLRDAGMADLADAITGHHGRYMLDLAAARRHGNVTAAPHRTSQP